MAVAGMIHQRPAAGARAALEQRELTGELGMVQEMDPSLGEQGLALQIGRGLVEVCGLGGAELGQLVAHALGLEALDHPARRIEIPGELPEAMARS